MVRILQRLTNRSISAFLEASSSLSSTKGSFFSRHGTFVAVTLGSSHRAKLSCLSRMLPLMSRAFIPVASSGRRVRESQSMRQRFTHRDIGRLVMPAAAVLLPSQTQCVCVWGGGGACAARGGSVGVKEGGRGAAFGRRICLWSCGVGEADAETKSWLCLGVSYGGAEVLVVQLGWDSHEHSHHRSTPASPLKPLKSKSMRPRPCVCHAAFCVCTILS